MLQDRKRQNRKKNTTGSTTAPRPHYVLTKLSSINLRISSFALLSGRAREPEPFSFPPFVFFRRLDGPAPALSAGGRFALASLGDARAADALRFVVVKHAAAITVEPPATSSLTDVAMRGLRCSVLLMAQFTVGTRHGAPLRCVELFGSAAARAPSFLCCVCPLFACPCVCPTCTIAGHAVPNLHYNGIFLYSAGPALLRALSVSRDFTCTIPGTCTIQPAL